MELKILWLVALTIMMLSQVILALVKALTAKNKRKTAEQEGETTSIAVGNPNDKPGKAQECLKHMKALAKMDEKITGIKDDIRDNVKPRIDAIFRRLDKT